MRLIRYFLSVVLMFLALGAALNSAMPECFYRQPIKDALTSLSTLKDKGIIAPGTLGFRELVEITKMSSNYEGRSLLSKCNSVRIQYSGAVVTSLGANAIFLDKNNNTLIAIQISALEAAIKEAGKLVERPNMLLISVVIFFLTLINARLAALPE